MAIALAASMDNRPFGHPVTMSSVSNYLTSSSYTSPYYGSSPAPAPQLGYSFPEFPQTYNAFPPNLTLVSCTERALAKERRREQNRASQRAYRKRKELTVQGLYENIKQLQKGAESLKAENGDLKGHNEVLQAELERLAVENQQLKGRRSLSQRSACVQCSQAGVRCDRKDSTCKRCKMAEMACSSPEPDPGLSTRRPTLESAVTSEPEENAAILLSADDDDDGLRSFWFEFEDDINPIASELTDEVEGSWGIPSFDPQALLSKNDSGRYMGIEKLSIDAARASHASFPSTLTTSFATPSQRPGTATEYNTSTGPHSMQSFLPISYGQRRVSDSL